MPKVPIPYEELVCVRHKDGWCATRKKTTEYADRIKTVCGMVVTFPMEIECTEPDCPDCLQRLGLSEPRR